ASVARLAEEAESFRSLSDVPCRDGQRMKHAALEQGNELCKHLLDPVGPSAYEVESSVSHAGVDSSHSFRGANVRLAHLEKAATSRQKAQGRVHELPREGVEDDIHAATLGGTEKVLLEVERARGSEVGVIESERTERGPLAWTGGAEDLGAQMSCELDSGH